MTKEDQSSPTFPGLEGKTVIEDKTVVHEADIQAEEEVALGHNCLFR